MAPPVAALEHRHYSVAVGPSLSWCQAELQAALGDGVTVVELLASNGGDEDVAVLGTAELAPGETEVLRTRGRHSVVLVGLGGDRETPIAIAGIVEALRGGTGPG